MRRDIRLISLGIILILVAIYIIPSLFKLSHSFSNSNGVVTRAPSEYTELFDSTAQKKLIPNYTNLSKVRSPNSILTYDNKYTVYIFKISQSIGEPLQKIIHLQKGKDGMTDNIAYSEVLRAPIEIDVNADSIPKVSNIYLIINGISNQAVVNDSVYGFHAYFSDFSIKYSKDSPTDITASAQTHISADFLFLAKSKSLYLLFMSPDDKAAGIDPRLLYSLIEK